MIISIAGVLGGADLSSYLDRNATFSIESAIGKRMDTGEFTLMDSIPGVLAIPDRAEVIVYNELAGHHVVDPPWAISAWNTKQTGGVPNTSTDPSQWTARLFGGYCAQPGYLVEGRQRYITVTCQDYTVRLRTTVVNQAFAPAFSDKTIVQQIFARYRPDFVATDVQQLVASMPAISFPVHSLEQFMERIIKTSRAYYRVDYYKQLHYGAAGLQQAPFDFSDTPDFTTTYPAERLHYVPDSSSLSNRVWVIGQTFTSATQDYQVPVSLVDGSHYQFPLPGSPDTTGMTCTVGGVDQGRIGVAPADGDLTDQSSFKANVLLSKAPPVLALRVTPANGTVIHLIGKYRYPLVQIVNNPTLLAQMNNVAFEAVVRDRRINDLTLAQLVGAAYLNNQGISLKGGTLNTKYIGVPGRAGAGTTAFRWATNYWGPAVWGAATSGTFIVGNLLQPGQLLRIKNQSLFEGGVLTDGLGNPTTTAVVLITRTRLLLDNDSNQPFLMEVSFADRAVSGGY